MKITTVELLLRHLVGEGAAGYRIERPGELAAILPEAIERAVPTVIDVRIDPTEVPPIDRWIQGVGISVHDWMHCDEAS